MLRFKHSQCTVRVESFIHNTAKQCAHFLMELCLGNAVYEERVLIPSFSEPVAAKVALQLGQGLLIIHKKGTKPAVVVTCLVRTVLADVSSFVLTCRLCA